MSTQGSEQRDDVQKALALRASQWRADLLWIMQQDAGKRFLGHFVRESRKRPFTTDANVTHYNLGRLEFVRELLDQLRDVDMSLFQVIERTASEKKS